MFFDNFGAELLADVETVLDAGCVGALKALQNSAMSEDTVASLAQANTLLEVTTTKQESGWDHVCYRELHVLCLFTRAICTMKDAPLDAMRDIDMGIILGAPNELYASILAEAEPLCKAAFFAKMGKRVPKFSFPKEDPEEKELDYPIDTAPEDINAATFKSEYYKKEVPIVIKSPTLLAEWDAFKKWSSVRYFVEAGGWRVVPTEVGCKRNVDRRASYVWHEEATTLHDFLIRRVAKRGDGPPAYLAQHGLLAQIPQLDADAPTPSLLAEVATPETITKNCWIGSADTVTELHCDSYDNLFVQVAGFKYIRLYSPKHARRLYVGHRGTNGDGGQGNCSSLLCEAEDFVAHPLARNVPYIETVLAPGEALFIPEGWFHYLRAVTPSASVNHWF